MSTRLLFIPVSSAKGIGEYMRSLSIAQALASRHPTLDIRFVLSEEAPYHQDCPFPYFLCPSSPTKHSDLVAQYMKEFQPSVVLFDASGRVQQLQEAKALGAETIFICQHNKKMRKGLGFRRLRFTDHIFIVQPDFAVAALSPWQKLKIALLNKKAPKAIGPIFSSATKADINEALDKYQLTSKRYILVNAGSGGHMVGHINASAEFAQAAEQLSNEVEEKLVIVYGPNYQGEHITNDKCLNIDKMDSRLFNALLSQAKAAILAGGSALFQGISYGTKSVSCAVSKDQQERIQACANEGLTSPSPLDARTLAQKTKQLLNSSEVIDTQKVQSGLGRACDEIEKMIKRKQQNDS